MRTARGLLVFLGIVAVSGCGGSPPCTECPNVAGYYLADAKAQSSDRSSCKALSFTGISGQIRLTQDKSALSTTELWGLRGILHTDLTASFGPADAVTTSGEAATVTLSGTFSGSEGRRTYAGTLSARTKDGKCSLSAPLKLTQTVE